ncbi:MAG: hypothetical protein QOD40_3176 [Alphaproteobacteria bacterium]|jgi:Ni/Co efflux regulator RcnB|nr:hypothetical protein [Alphaproteobacteria bacterium]
MQRSLRYGVIALTLLAGAGLAQSQEKSQQNTADEALTNRTPSQGERQGNEAKQDAAPQTGPQMAIPGTQAVGQDKVFQDGKLAAPGAPQGTQDEPAKFSAKNNADDKTPTMAWPPALTAEQKQAIYSSISSGQAPIVISDAKPADKFNAWAQYQDLPSDVTDKIPFVRDYKYVRLQDKILLINPRERIVVGEITK